jgi:hypothetical protein
VGFYDSRSNDTRARIWRPHLRMAPRFLTILTGRNPKIRQPREREPSTINEKTIADFLERGLAPTKEAAN